MALQGTIKDFGLADILQLIGIQRKTGILTVDNGDDAVTVSFVDGQIVGADTRKRNLEDLLGTVLVRTGRITEEQLQDALKIQKGSLQRLGYVLVRTASISEEDLREALRIQVTQIVYRLFRWREGAYHFAPTDHVEYDAEHFTPIGAETILMEGARMVDEWPIIERRLKSPNLVFRKSEAGARLDLPVASLMDADVDLELDTAGASREKVDGPTLSTEERDVLHMLDGRLTLQDVVDRSPLGEFDTYRILYDLLDRNLVEEVRVESSERVSAAEERRSRIVAWTLSAAVVLLALASAALVPWNPVAPWDVAGVGRDTEALRLYASRGRLERVESALRIHYLDRGSMPADLSALVSGGYLSEPDLRDPWGRPYAYRLDPAGYEIAGLDAVGVPIPETTLKRRFSPVQRMVLAGAAAGAGAP